MLSIQPNTSNAIYRVAMSFTMIYAAFLTFGFWFTWLRGESADLFLLQSSAASIVVNVGLPTLANMAKNPMERRQILHRALSLVVALGIVNYAGLYYGSTYLYETGFPGWAAWFAAILVAGIITLLATYFTLGAPPIEKRAIEIASHIGALRPGEKWLRGAKIEAAPQGQTIDRGRLSVGGIPLEWDREVQHTFLNGAAGTGKTQVAEGFLRAIRERALLPYIKKSPRVIILDPGGAYYSRFGQDGDVVLNPFDARSVAWSPFAEIKRPQDFNRLAAAFVPLAEGPNKEWSEFGRKTMADTMRAMVTNDEKNPQELFRLLDGSAENLAFYLNNAEIYGLTGEENMKMFSNAKATIAPNIEIFQYLKPDGAFSVRDWIRKGDEANESGWLFITYRDDQMKLLRQFVAAMADLAILEGLSLPSNEGLPVEEHRRLFYFMDELDSIGAVSELKDALIKLRKFGGCCVLGLQTISQLRAVYGRDTTRAILGNVATNVVLRPQDGETAEEMEKLLGEQDIERETISFSQSSGNSRPGMFGSGHSNTSTGRTANEQKQIVTRKCVLASELQNMENLHGILMRPASPHHPFALDYVEMPRINAPFVEHEYAG